jgi:hypothetical protein
MADGSRGVLVEVVGSAAFAASKAKWRYHYLLPQREKTKIEPPRVLEFRGTLAHSHLIKSLSFVMTNSSGRSAYINRMIHCIDSNNWADLEYMLRTNPKEFKAVSAAISRSPHLNGMTVIHSCIRFNPPPHIVQLIIQLDPTSVSSVDCLNRTPLHIAAAVRADLQSIMLLICEYRRACAVQDVDGKTPLHFACDIYW